MRTTRHTAWMALLAVLAVACSADGDGPPADTSSDSVASPLGAPIAEAVVLESADGVVSLEIPAGSVGEGTDLGIDVIEPTEIDGLDGAPTLGAAYRLRPVGLVLPEPLVVVIRLPADAEADGATSIPLTVAVVEHEDVVRAEIEGRTAIDGSGTVVHRAALDRFGALALVDTGVRLEMDPVAVTDLTPGESFEVALLAHADSSVTTGIDLQVRWSVAGGASSPSVGEIETISDLRVDDGETVTLSTAEVTCDVIGSGTHSVEVRVDTAGPPVSSVQFVVIDGESACGDVGR